VIQATPASTLLNSDDDGVVMGGLGVVVMVLGGLDEEDTKRVFNKAGWAVTTSHNSVFAVTRFSFGIAFSLPVRSSAARAALRSTRLLLHLFRASYS